MKLDDFLFKDKARYRSIILTTFFVGTIFGALLFWGMSGYFLILKKEGLSNSLPLWYLICVLPIQTGVLFQIVPATYMLIRRWYSFLKFRPMLIQVVFGFMMLLLYSHIMLVSILVLIYLLIDAIVSFTKRLLKSRK